MCGACGAVVAGPWHASSCGGLSKPCTASHGHICPLHRSLGVCLYECCAQAHPFDADNQVGEVIVGVGLR